MGAEVEKKEMRGMRNYDGPGTLESHFTVFYPSFYRKPVPADIQHSRRSDRGSSGRGKGAGGRGSHRGHELSGHWLCHRDHQRLFRGHRPTGRGREKEQIRTSVAACGWLCAAVTAVMTLLSAAGADPLLRLMNTPEDISSMPPAISGSFSAVWELPSTTI